MKRAVDFLSKTWNSTLSIVNRVSYTKKPKPKWLIIFFLIIGIAIFEYLYFTTSSEVRLLFVLLLIPFGALIGWEVLYILNYFLREGFRFAFWATIIALIIYVIYQMLRLIKLIIVFLYEIIITTN